MENTPPLHILLIGFCTQTELNTFAARLSQEPGITVDARPATCAHAVPTEKQLAPYQRIVVYETLHGWQADWLSFVEWLREVANNDREESHVWVIAGHNISFDEQVDNYAGMNLVPPPLVTWLTGGWKRFITCLRDPWHGG